MALNLSRNTKVFVSKGNGVFRDISSDVGVAGGVKTAYISAAGDNYAVGDIVTFSGGTSGSTGFKCEVLAISGGGADGPVTAIGIPNNFRGEGYAAADVLTEAGVHVLADASTDVTTRSSASVAGLQVKVLTVAGTTTADGARKARGLFKGNGTDANTFRLGVLDGYSFSQGSDSTDVTISEAGAAPNRGSKRFNDSLPPAEWSFGTYVRPFVHGATSFRANTTFDAVENILWAALSGTGLPNASDTAGAGVEVTTGSTYGSLVKFDQSDVHELMKLQLYFALENTTYRLNDAQINQAEVDFSIDGIASITWSGNATTIDQVEDPIEDPSKYYVTVYDADGTWDTSNSVALLNTAGLLHSSLGTISQSGGVLKDGDGNATVPFNNTDTYVETFNYVDTTGPADADYLRNKLSSLHLETDAQGGGSASNGLDARVYDINITGGSLTIANNVTYVTPETIGVVDKPIGSFTGARVISGSLTMYLDTKADGSNQLLTDLSGATDLVTNVFDMRLFMGVSGSVDAGEDTMEADDFTAPGVEFKMAKAHLTVPTLEVGDLVSASLEFAAHGTDLLTGDELDVKYLGSTVHTQSGYKSDGAHVQPAEQA